MRPGVSSGGCHYRHYKRVVQAGCWPVVGSLSVTVQRWTSVLLRVHRLGGFPSLTRTLSSQMYDRDTALRRRA